MLTYTTFKMLHVFGVVLFLGNIIVTGVWKYRADVTGRPDVIAFAQRLVTLTDWVFTFGGAVLILIGGFGMVGVAGLDPHDLMGENRIGLVPGIRSHLGRNPDPDPGRPRRGSRGLSRPAAKFPSAIGGLIGSGTCGARSQRSCRCSTSM
jgi:hypothetical protein